MSFLATINTTNASGKRVRTVETEQSPTNKKAKITPCPTTVYFVKEYGNEMLERLDECEFSSFVDDYDTVKEAEKWVKLQGDFTRLTRAALELAKKGRKRHPSSAIGLLHDIILQALENTESSFDAENDEHDCTQVTLGKLSADDEFVSKLAGSIKDAVYGELDQLEDDDDDEEDEEDDDE